MAMRAPDHFFAMRQKIGLFSGSAFPFCSKIVMTEECANVSGRIGLDSAQASLACVQKEGSGNDEKQNLAYRKLLARSKDNPGSGMRQKAWIVSARKIWIVCRNAAFYFCPRLDGSAREWRIANKTQCLADLSAGRTKILRQYLRQTGETE